MRVLPLLLICGFLGLATAEKVVCYYGSWAVWRPGDGKFDVEDIDPFLCTHIVLGFAGLSNVTWTIEVLDPWNELCPEEPGGNSCAYDRFVALKEINPDLTALLAVGGWNEGSVDYSVMSGDPEKRRTFIDSTVELVRKHKFDGLDMDWEYPAHRGGAPEDKENFVTLISELREAFDQYDPPLFLSVALSPGKPTIDEAYDIPALAPLFDQLHIMAYDYHGAWDNFTHHNAPLCGYYLDWGEYVYFSVVYTINYYLELGVPAEKLIMGIPTYGRCFTLDDISDHGMLAPTHKPGTAGPYIRIDGTLGFNEICLRFTGEDDSCTIVHDPAMHEPYFYCSSDNIWCGFDDAGSVYEKARYAKNMELGGVVVWTIDTDDFIPRCYDEAFHLVKNMKRALDEPADGQLPECVLITPTGGDTTTMETTDPPTTTPEPTTTTPEPTTTTPEPTTTTPEPTTTTPEPTTTTTPTTPKPTPSTTSNPGVHPKPDCSGQVDGTVYPHEDCNKYWECISGQPIIEMCAPGTLYDEDLHICNWESSVDTSNCNLWICEVDNVYYPAPDCDKYYRCYNGSPHLEQCPDDLYWNQNIHNCVPKANINTSDCNPV